MTSHKPFLDLAAAGIDFPLSATERARLERHLAECPACARRASALRSDAELIAATPRPRMPERRSGELLAAILRPRGLEHPVRLLIAIALLGLLLVGALVAGARFLEREADPLVVVPSPPIATPTASPLETARPSSPVPSPTAPALADHGVLALTHGDATGRTWIETVDLASGAVRKLADGSDPAWFGRSQVAYSCAGVGGDFTGVCFVGLDRLEPSTVVQDANRPAPAPDGRRVALHRGMVDVGETWAVLANGNELVRLASGSFLRWSPDGTTLLGQPESAAAQVAVVRADGTGMRVLAAGYDPAWSPDGSSIAYAVVQADAASLRVVDVASGSTTLRYSVPSPREIHAPVWLPDGAIVFVADGDLWRLDAGSSAPVRLTTGLSIAADDSAGRPVLSPDAGHVAFTTGSGPDARVGTASVTGGWALLDLPTGPTTQPVWAPDPVTLGPAGGGFGDRWTEADMPAAGNRPSGQIRAVAADASRFVAVGTGCPAEGVCEAIVLTSPDGITWTRAPKQDATDVGLGNRTSGPEIGMQDVAIGTPGIVAVGYVSAAELLPTAWFSTDGLSWSRTSLDTTLYRRVNAVTWTGSQFIAVGEDRDEASSAAAIAKASGRAAVWASSDGRTWTRITNPAFAAGVLVDTMEDPASGGMSDVVAGPKGIIAVGTTCAAPPAGCSAAVWASPDGTSWSRATVPALAGGLGDVTVTSDGYVATGGRLLLRSVDGATWTKSAAPASDAITQPTQIGDRLFVVAPVPDPPTGHFTPLWVSQDPAAWTKAALQGGVSPIEPGPDYATWRLAANLRTAVWFARTDTLDSPKAWYSQAGG